MVITRAQAATSAGVAKFRENERAWNMAVIVSDGGLRVIEKPFKCNY